MINERTTNRQRVSFYALGDACAVEALSGALQQESRASTLIDGAVHVPSWPAVAQKRGKNKAKTNQGDIFYFNFGCVVFWGLSLEQEQEMLTHLQPFIELPYQKHYYDVMYYRMDEEQEPHLIEEEDYIILQDEQDILVKLSFSYALAQSVKLDYYETSVLKTIRQTHTFTQELAQKGDISLSRQQLAKKIGALFLERHSLDLLEDSLDTPEFFWRRPRFEPLYDMAAECMDIQKRLTILNRRSDVVYELYNMLSNELNHLHSSRLEWIVIILIACEIILTLLHEWLRWGS